MKVTDTINNTRPAVTLSHPQVKKQAILGRLVIVIDNLRRSAKACRRWNHRTAGEIGTMIDLISTELTIIEKMLMLRLKMGVLVQGSKIEYTIFKLGKLIPR